MTGEAEVTDALGAFLKAGATPGLVAALVTSDAVRVVPLAQPAGGPQPGPRTPFGIASLSKLFTATVLADLVREGTLDLDRPVVEVAPEARRLPAWPGRPVTLRHLATHTSGLPVGRPNETLSRVRARWWQPRTLKVLAKWLAGGRGPIYRAITWDDIAAWLAGDRLARAPGVAWEYSNIGMALLGHAVGLAHGGGFERAVRERVLAPLGLARTFIGLPRGEPKPLQPMELGPLAGAGGLTSDLEDLARFVRAFLGDAPPPLRASLAATLRPAGKDEGGRLLFLGWQRDPVSGRLYHTGGTHAFAGVDPARKSGFVMLGAGSLMENEALGLAALAAAAGETAAFPKPRVAVDLEPAVLASRAGFFRLDKKSAVRFTPEGGALKAVFQNGGTAVLWPSDERKFFCREWECAVAFEPDGSAARVRMYEFDGLFRRVT